MTSWHSPSSSDVETGTGGGAPPTGLKLRSSRPSSNDLLCSAEDWKRGEKAERAAAASTSGGCSSCGGGATPSRSPRAQPVLPLALRRCWRRTLSAMLGLVLLLLLLANRGPLYRHGQDAAARLYYDLDPHMLGRSEAVHPAPRCCIDEGCAAGPGQRVAVVTYLRDDAYVPLLQQLECTLRRTNPGLELGLMMVPGELSEETLALARRLNITLLPVEPLDFRNTYDSRYSRNWIKLRALGLKQYHSVLLVDADVAIVGSLAPLFALPTEFAAVWDQSKWLNRYRTVVEKLNGGVFLLRPCPAVERHMTALLARYPKLRFTHSTAEQEFFGWYFRYSAATLPLQWNCMDSDCLQGNRTVGGVEPRILHFIKHKPFHGPQPGAPGHQFLCSLAELHRHTLVAALDQEQHPPAVATAWEQQQQQQHLDEQQQDLPEQQQQQQQPSQQPPG